MVFRFCLALVIGGLVFYVSTAEAGEVDRVLDRENRDRKILQQPVPIVDDLTFMRRVSVDLIGRIPTGVEIGNFLDGPSEDRRGKLVAKLLEHERFADRWTTFFGDLLRLRSSATGGSALTAYVHQAIDDNMPYDELCRRLISANGRVNNIPEVGFILGDDADPLAMAAVTAQTFMGIRLACAQCHDHPFDVWTRDDFYSLAAFFGKTRRIESQRTNVIYTTEVDQTSVLWPPEGESTEGRTAMAARFPFDLMDSKNPPEFITRLISLRTKQAAVRRKGRDGVSPVIEDLLVIAGEKASKTTRSKSDLAGIESEAKTAIRNIDIKGSLYRQSELRHQLAKYVTSPRNRFFARALVNRLWKELVGRGFVTPVDDFRADNPASHPKTLDFLAEEFVASGYDFRGLVQRIVSSEAYQRGHVAEDADEKVRAALEENFQATPMRRMLSESLYDSIVTAGHLFDVKYPSGVNNRTVTETVRVVVKVDDGGKEKPANVEKLAAISPENPDVKAAADTVMAARQPTGYQLEDSIELDFTSLLKKSGQDLEVEQMKVMSREELEAQRMVMEKRVQNDPTVKYVTKTVERIYDDNPKFNSTFRMAGPAADGHFLRVFGQTARADLGEPRDDAPTMRQALMMLNGRLTNEAARVGHLEPIYPLVAGEHADVLKAINLAYYEILTRLPNAQELADAKEVIGAASSPLDGMADLRWVLLNCNEFRFLP